MTTKIYNLSAPFQGDEASAANLGFVGANSSAHLVGPCDAELQQSQARFRALIEHVSEGVFITDSTGIFVDANPCALDLLGRTREELLGRHINDMIVANERSRVATDVARALSGQLQMSEWLFLRPDGTTFRGEICARMLPDGYLLATLRDESKRRQTEQALRESEARTRALADNLPVGVFMAGPDGQNNYSNAVLQKQLGRSFGAMLGEVWAESGSIHSADRRRMAEAWQEFCARRAPFDIVARFVNSDGEIRFIQSRINAVQTGGRVVGYVGSTEDLTERRRVEDKVIGELCAQQQELERTIPRPK